MTSNRNSTSTTILSQPPLTSRNHTTAANNNVDDIGVVGLETLNRLRVRNPSCSASSTMSSTSSSSSSALSNEPKHHAHHLDLSSSSTHNHHNHLNSSYDLTTATIDVLVVYPNGFQALKKLDPRYYNYKLYFILFFLSRRHFFFVLHCLQIVSSKITITN
jgi:hypothetical protein